MSDIEDLQYKLERKVILEKKQEWSFADITENGLLLLVMVIWLIPFSICLCLFGLIYFKG